MRIVFIGTGEIGMPTLRMLLNSGEHQVLGVVTQPDKPAGRSQELRPSPIKELALRHQAPVLQPPKIRLPAAVDEIRSLHPEAIVVMAYGQILPRDLLQIPPVACLNLHASLLPRHRGAAPIHAAIDAGDAESGITVMHIDEGLDTGDIVLKKSTPIRRRETSGSLHNRLAEIAPGALTEALELLARGAAPRAPQDPALATYAPKLDREKGELDWTASRFALDRRIRAMNPWPAAYTWLPDREGKPRKLKIFCVILVRRAAGPPGEVLRADRRGVLVATGEGALLLREIQAEGKKRMSARDFLLGNPVPAGSVLGKH